MTKYALLAAAALAGALSITGCSQQDNAQQAASQAVAAVSKPTDPNDAKGWNAYFGSIVQKNMQGMTADRPFPYLVPAADDDAYGRQLEAVQDVIARGVLPGNLLVFAGTNSTKTADLITTAFKDAKPGSFKDVIILFIGDAADQERVQTVLQPTGATVRFAAM